MLVVGFQKKIHSFFAGKVSFDLNEFSGSFGDIGTDLPLIAGIILICGLDSASVFIVFGLLQIFTGLFYGLPMPVQPLKIMAVIMISQKLSGNLLYGAGLAIGVVMLFLTATGLLQWLAGIVPKSVVRGIQLGLGISLASLALKNFVASNGWAHYLLAFFGFLLVLTLYGNRKYPPALFVILLGVLYTVFFDPEFWKISGGFGLALPRWHIPNVQDILHGFVLLALPQIPLSLSNSLIATKQTIEDLFPARAASLTKLGFTYSLMNLLNPFFSGVPTCHGAGGLAGHYAFGARTGGSVVIYGSLYLFVGLFFSRGFDSVLRIFPLPILGVILFFEGLAMMSFIRDITGSKKDLFIAFLVALFSVGLPQGFLIGLIAGTLFHYFFSHRLEEM